MALYTRTVLAESFLHMAKKGRQAVVIATTSRSQRRIVAATPRPFHVSKLFQLCLGRSTCSQQQQQAHGSSAYFRWLALSMT
jgi:hypothetical protein